MKRKNILLLLIIICFAFWVRLWHLGNFPDGFHADEAAFGYNAYSIMLTGKDEYGKLLPLTLRSFDDYKGAIYAYLTIPSVFILGLTKFAVRLPSMLFSSALCFIVFLLSQKLLHQKKTSFLTAFLAATSPVLIFHGRIQSDPLVSVFFLLCAFYFFLLWLESQKTWHCIAQAIFILISFFTYASPRLFCPVYLLLIYLFYFKKLIPHKCKIMFFSHVFLLLLSTLLVFGGSGKRFGQAILLNSPSVAMPIEENLLEDRGDLFGKIFHNKPHAYIRFFLANFFSYLSPNFLYLNGGLPPREIVPETGLFYLVEMPFFLWGVYHIFRRKQIWGKFMMLWLILSTCLLSLSIDDTPNSHRFLLIVFPIELITAFGISRLQAFSLKNIWRLAFLLGTSLNFSFFLHQLLFHQPMQNLKSRGFAYEELSTQISKQMLFYKKIVLTKAHEKPYIYLLFYLKYNPTKYQSYNSPRDFNYTGFDKFFFVPDHCPLEQDRFPDKKNILFISHGDCVIPPSGDLKLIQYIKWADSSNAFVLTGYK